MTSILDDIDFLKDNQREIQEKANSSCEISKSIITYYIMFSNCQESGSQMFLQESIKEYKLKYK